MKCPIDNTDLQMSDRQGIEIDYCPQCRGVWLDRGELDKLIERSENQGSYQAAPPAGQPRYEERQESHSSHNYDRPPQHRERRDYDDDDYRHNDGHHGHHKKHKKEGFLGDLFDF